MNSKTDAKKGEMARRMGHFKNFEHARKSAGKKNTSEIMNKHND